jgi:hypothetical protein
MGGAEEDALAGIWHGLTYGPRSQWRARDLYYYYQLMDQAIAITRLPERDRIPAADRFSGEVSDIPETCYLARLIMPAIGRCYTVEIEARAALQVARTALAVEEWRVAHGGWPDSLQALVPELLQDVPQDPFSQGTLGYARLAGGVCVYSLGKDGWEDGVARNRPRSEPFDGWGITFRLLDPKLRGAREMEFAENPDAVGATLLHVAARIGNVELAKQLIDAGWDVNALDDEGRTPAAVAAESAHEDVAGLIRENGGAD